MHEVAISISDFNLVRDDINRMLLEIDDNIVARLDAVNERCLLIGSLRGLALLADKVHEEYLSQLLNHDLNHGEGFEGQASPRAWALLRIGKELTE